LSIGFLFRSAEFGASWSLLLGDSGFPLHTTSERYWYVYPPNLVINLDVKVNWTTVSRWHISWYRS